MSRIIPLLTLSTLLAACGAETGAGSHIRVHSQNPELQSPAERIVETRVATKVARELTIEMTSCSTKTAIRICVRAVVDHRVVSTSVFGTEANCDDKEAQLILEDMLFRDADIQKQFADFVSNAAAGVGT